MRKWNNRAENIAALALVFRSAGSIQLVLVELRVFDGEQMKVLCNRDNAGSYRGLPSLEIPKPNEARNGQKYDEDDDLSLLLHDAVRK